MKTTDIVIPLNESGSGNKDLELRYALRSIEENLIGYRNIIVVCVKPPHWLKNVVNLPIYDGNRKSITLFEKRIGAAKLSDADNIVLWSDDQVILERLNVLSIPALRIGTEPMESNQDNTPWGQVLRNTAKVLHSKNKTSFNCESHSPCLLDRKKFISLESIFYDEIYEFPGIVTGSLYHNYFLSPMQDMDIFKTTFSGKACLDSMTSGSFGAKIFLGYDNIGFNNGIKEFLEYKFINKSKYEV